MTMRDTQQRTAAPDGRPESEQPAWRRDFPIDIPQDQYLARRDFAGFMVLTSLAFVAGQFWIAVSNWIRRRRGRPPVRRIAALADVPVGAALLFRYPTRHDACLLLRPGKDELVAYHQQCTHLSCAVVPQIDQGRLYCPCHRGIFDLATGRPTAGPPRRPLPRIVLEIRRGAIYAVGLELRAA